VASFSGGAVGVISALMVVEINNVKQQEHKRCKYCLGTGKFSSKTFSFLKQAGELCITALRRSRTGLKKPLQTHTNMCPEAHALHTSLTSLQNLFMII